MQSRGGSWPGCAGRFWAAGSYMSPFLCLKCNSDKLIPRPNCLILDCAECGRPWTMLYLVRCRAYIGRLFNIE